jgi:serine/threonine-protein kinase
MAAKAPDFKPGETLPGTKYRVVKQIGAGGMGVVYQVVKPPEIQGVLKLMSTDLTSVPELRTRFLDEVRVLAQLDHPNIVKVFDYDTLPDKTPFYVMELLHGRTVRDVLATMGTLPPRVAFEVTRQLCEALHCAHTHDIPVVHRDIKPENIFLHAPRHGEPVVKLIDFGVVAVADREHDGTFVGTWKYAAPEQIRGERATPATDLYAVGLVLYEMLCGIGPFEHLESGTLVSQAHLKEIPAPVSKFAPWVPPSIVELIASALAKEPRQRPRDAYAFAERLYELEWANDGKDPNDHTAEGPLSRILSTASGAKPSSKNMALAPPRDRLGNVPIIGVPVEARHGGPTIKGVGGQGNESTMPDEDALLAGLVGRPDERPRSKKERESDRSLDDGEQIVIRPGAGGEVELAATPRVPRVVGRADVRPRVEIPTMDAQPGARSAEGEHSGGWGMKAPSVPRLGAALAIPGPANTDPSDAFSEGTTKKLSARGVDTDTFATQESDTERATKRSGRLALPIALAVTALVGSASFAVYRARMTATATPPPPSNELSAVTAKATAEPLPPATVTPTPNVPPSDPVPSSPSAPVSASPSTAPAPKLPTSLKVPHPPSKGTGNAASSLGSTSPVPPTVTTPAKAPEVPAKTPPSSSKPDESFLRKL